MTDFPLQKTAKTARRGRGRPFPKGESGNPTGRPRGSSNRVTLYSSGHRHPWAGEAGIDTRGRVRFRLKDLLMPDLDLIKQGKQGARDRRGRAPSPLPRESQYSR